MKKIVISVIAAVLLINAAPGVFAEGVTEESEFPREEKAEKEKKDKNEKKEKKEKKKKEECAIKENYRGLHPYTETSLDLEEAREKARHNSPELKNLEIKGKQLKEGIKMAEDRYDRLDELSGKLEELDSALDEPAENMEELARELKEVADLLRELADIWDDQEEFQDYPVEDIADWAESMAEAIESLAYSVDRMAGMPFVLGRMVREAENEVEEFKLEAEQKKKELDHQKDLWKLKKEQARKMVEFQSEALYVGILALEESSSYMEEAVNVLEENKKEKRAELNEGKAVELELEAVELEKKQAAHARLSLKNQKRNLSRQLARLTGASLYTVFELEDVQVKPREYDLEDKLKALDTGKQIEIAREELDYAGEYKQWTRENYGAYSPEARMAEHEYDLAEINYRDTDLKMEKLLLEVYEKCREAEMEYRMAEDASDLQEDFYKGILVQEELGMVSDMEVLEGKLESKETELVGSLAGYQLNLAQRQFQLVSGGYMTENYLEQFDLQGDFLNTGDQNDETERKDNESKERKQGNGDAGRWFLKTQRIGTLLY